MSGTKRGITSLPKKEMDRKRTSKITRRIIMLNRTTTPRQQKATRNATLNEKNPRSPARPEGRLRSNLELRKLESTFCSKTRMNKKTARRAMTARKHLHRIVQGSSLRRTSRTRNKARTRQANPIPTRTTRVRNADVPK
jgi:hypothetical protein